MVATCKDDHEMLRWQTQYAQVADPAFILCCILIYKSISSLARAVCILYEHNAVFLDIK
jgi:hypothetical protein